MYTLHWDLGTGWGQCWAAQWEVPPAVMAKASQTFQQVVKLRNCSSVVILKLKRDSATTLPPSPQPSVFCQQPG